MRYTSTDPEKVRMAVWLQARIRVCGFGLRPRLNSGRVCDAERQRGGIYGIRRYVNDEPLPLPSFE